MSKKLCQCPFCGGEAREQDIIIVGRGLCKKVFCEKCHIDFKSSTSIEHWNTRPAEDALRAEIAKLATELNNINLLADMILRRANFGSKATKADMHERLTSIYVYASQIKRAFARTDNAPDTIAESAEESR